MIESLPEFAVKFVWEKSRKRRFGMEMDILRVALTWFRRNPDYGLFIEFSDDFQRDPFMDSHIDSALLAQHQKIADVYESCKTFEQRKLEHVKDLLIHEVDYFVTRAKTNVEVNVPVFVVKDDFEKSIQLCLKLLTSLRTKRWGTDLAMQMIRRRARPLPFYHQSFVVCRGRELYEYSTYLKMFRLLAKFPRCCDELKDEDLIVFPVVKPCGLVLTISKPVPAFRSLPFWFLNLEDYSTTGSYEWLMNDLNEIDRNRSGYIKTLTVNSPQPVWIVSRKSSNGYFVNTFYIFRNEERLMNAIFTDVTGKSLICATFYEPDVFYMLKVSGLGAEIEKVIYDTDAMRQVSRSIWSLPDQYRNTNSSIHCLSNGNVVVFAEGSVDVTTKTVAIDALLVTDDRQYTQYKFHVKDDRFPNDTLAETTVSGFVGETAGETIIVRHARNLSYPKMFHGRVLIFNLQHREACFRTLYAEDDEKYDDDDDDSDPLQVQHFIKNGYLNPNACRMLPYTAQDSYCVSYWSKIPSTRMNFWVPSSGTGKKNWTNI